MQEKNELNVIQNIIIPDISSKCYPLFLKCDSHTNSTFTYFNIFFYKLWDYLIKSNFALYIKFRGIGLFKIIYLDVNFKTTFIDHINIDSDSEQILFFNIKPGYAYVYLEWEMSLKIIYGYFCAENTPKNNTNILLIVPTFNRQKEIYDLVDVYINTIDKYKQLSNHSNLYIINNNDFELDIRHSNIVINNTHYNIGGAGSFILGAQYSIEHSYSHVIFMDDDALPLPETIFRTFALLKNLKTSLSDSFISGSMFLKDNPLDIYAYAEYVDSNYRIQPYRCEKKRIDTSDSLVSFFKSVYSQQQYAIYNCTRYAGWWYCAIPTKYFYKGSFPLNIFFNGDDIEYCLRLKPNIIVLNGICTWHPAFSSKVSILRQYFSTRNKIFIRLKHHNISKLDIFLFVCKKFYELLFKNRFTSYIDLIASYRGMTYNEEDLNNNLSYIKSLLKINLYDQNILKTKPSFCQKFSIFLLLPSIFYRIIKKI